VENIKDTLYEQNPPTLQKLKHAFQREINNISRYKYCALINTLRRFKDCIQVNILRPFNKGTL
jgi:hypothetical protein